MSKTEDFVELIEGICGAETDIIVTLRSEEKDAAITNIMKRCAVKKSVGFMSELEFQGVTFRLFSSGRAVFRGIKDKKELNKILTALLL
jgi:hypothetical protein